MLNGDPVLRRPLARMLRVLTDAEGAGAAPDGTPDRRCCGMSSTSGGSRLAECPEQSGPF